MIELLQVLNVIVAISIGLTGTALALGLLEVWQRSQRKRLMQHADKFDTRKGRREQPPLAIPVYALQYLISGLSTIMRDVIWSRENIYLRPHQNEIPSSELIAKLRSVGISELEAELGETMYAYNPFDRGFSGHPRYRKPRSRREELARYAYVEQRLSQMLKDYSGEKKAT